MELIQVMSKYMNKLANTIHYKKEHDKVIMAQFIIELHVFKIDHLSLRFNSRADLLYRHDYFLSRISKKILFAFCMRLNIKLYKTERD